KLRWNALLFVCDNLAIFPGDNRRDLRTAEEISIKDISKSELAKLLLNWRIHGIMETERFIWPYFTPANNEAPVAAWAPPNAPAGDQNADTEHRHLTPHERQEVMKDLAGSMNYHSAASIGNIHRLLQQPLVRGQEDDLRNALMHSSGDALAYVCTDIQRLLTEKFAKDDLVNQLMLW
ncbi:hypothetical protein EV360DRAFT_23562, partial [Lentinula raphanica]